MRTKYGKLELPLGDCLPGASSPPPRQRPDDAGADSNGDTHLLTFDGLRYDFQAVGEFVATRDSAGGFEIQQPVLGSRMAPPHGPGAWAPSRLRYRRQAFRTFTGATRW